MKTFLLGILVGLYTGLLVTNYNIVLGFLANPTVATLSRSHVPLKSPGHWHIEVDANTGFVYAAPGYCGVEVSCE